jgi:hypothetical protein
MHSACRSTRPPAPLAAPRQRTRTRSTARAAAATLRRPPHLTSRRACPRPAPLPTMLAAPLAATACLSSQAAPLQCRLWCPPLLEASPAQPTTHRWVVGAVDGSSGGLAGSRQPCRCYQQLLCCELQQPASKQIFSLELPRRPFHTLTVRCRLPLPPLPGAGHESSPAAGGPLHGAPWLLRASHDGRCPPALPPPPPRCCGAAVRRVRPAPAPCRWVAAFAAVPTAACRWCFALAGLRLQVASPARLATHLLPAEHPLPTWPPTACLCCCVSACISTCCLQASGAASREGPAAPGARRHTTRRRLPRRQRRRGSTSSTRP